MATFEKYLCISLIPVSRNSYLFLIPCYAYIVFQRLQPEGNFDIPWLTVFGKLRLFIPNATQIPPVHFVSTLISLPLPLVSIEPGSVILSVSYTHLTLPTI